MFRCRSLMDDQCMWTSITEILYLQIFGKYGIKLHVQRRLYTLSFLWWNSSISITNQNKEQSSRKKRVTPITSITISIRWWATTWITRRWICWIKLLIIQTVSIKIKLLNSRSTSSNRTKIKKICGHKRSDKIDLFSHLLSQRYFHFRFHFV